MMACISLKKKPLQSSELLMVQTILFEINIKYLNLAHYNY